MFGGDVNPEHIGDSAEVGPLVQRGPQQYRDADRIDDHAEMEAEVPDNATALWKTSHGSKSRYVRADILIATL